MKKLSEEKIIFASIILIASILRFWNYWNWSFTHDELGAFVRLNYDSFSELIAKGVRDTDTHPAFVQLFLFVWTKVFGLSEAAIRLPFVVAGIVSVALAFLIAKKWFGFATACFSSLTLAILDFPILYSQLARPYSFGLFFSLLATWCWTNLLFGSGKRIFLKATLYGTATALCMLTHYFAFFFAMIVAATGFLFLRKETWKPYLLSGGIAILIFLPHIPISLHQFGMGGVGEWLAKPESDYLWKFILYGFNDSLNMAWSISRYAATVRKGSSFSSLSFLMVSPKLSILIKSVLTYFGKNTVSVRNFYAKLSESFQHCRKTSGWGIWLFCFCLIPVKIKRGKSKCAKCGEALKLFFKMCGGKIF
ncbi:MAG: glycosyltransferase family 39 protein [Bacteroidota bacterium]